MKVVVIVDGGMVAEVFADAEVEVVVVDYDTDGIDEEELKDNGYSENAHFYFEGIAVNPELVERYFGIAGE